MARLTKSEACNILAVAHVSRNSDFHALSSSKVHDLMYWANSVGYRKPKNANGSRARYFHAYLQRRCR